MTGYSHDVIVIGHGLAGAVLVHQLRERGLTAHVFDVPQEGSASRAAAGVVNPISLRRDVLTWRAPEMLASARQCYTSFEEAHGLHIWHPTELIKIFPTAAEAAQWQRAMAREDTAPFLSGHDPPELANSNIPAPHGHGVVHQCAWLDLRVMLQEQRSWLSQTGQFTEKHIAVNDIDSISGGVRIGRVSAPWLVHCGGPFSSVPGLVPVKGEVLTVRIPELQLRSMVHRGIFILPIGDHLFRIGSTYEWNDVWQGPTASAQDHLMEKLKALVSGDIELIEHRAGVRPASRDRRPILGILKPHQAVFNGLGSRGVMLASWCADHLIEHLFEDQQLDPEVNCERFTSP